MTNRPKQHPPLQSPKIGVLLINLGTPSATDYWSVRRYLSEFLSDTRVVDYPRYLWQPLLQGLILSCRPFRSSKAYRKIWDKTHNASPLAVHTRAQCLALAPRLAERNIVCAWAMRYGKPSIAAGLDALLTQGCRQILLFALYPQYSGATVATAYDKAFTTLAKTKWQPAIKTATPWCDDPAYIALLGESIKQHYAQKSTQPQHLIMSFHGLPKRYLREGDPYHCMCHKTSRMTREYLDWPESTWHTTFQSRFGPESWLEPYTDETLKHLAAQGTKHIAVVSPAFVSDCLETLEEINIQLRAMFMAAGGETFDYIPCLNASDAHIDFLEKRIVHELGTWSE